MDQWTDKRMIQSQRSRFLFFLPFTLVMWSACSSLSDEELWKRVEAAKAGKNWDSTLIVSQRILTEFPSGRFASWARFAMAESYRFKNQPREALDNYRIFEQTYPEMQAAPLSLFLVGYLYANNLQQTDSAKYYYRQFLERYPQHELIPTVQLELNSLGLTPEQALEQVQKGSRTEARR